MLTSPEASAVAFITEVDGEWLWHVLPDLREGIEETYVAAESAAVACLRERANSVLIEKPAARKRKQPR